MSIVNDILTQIQDQINNTNLSQEFDQKWQIVEVRDWVATVSGLSWAMFSELVRFDNDIYGLVLDLNPDSVGVLILGSANSVNVGMLVHSTGKVLSVPVWDIFLGRVVDALAKPIDGLWDIKSDNSSAIEKIAPWVMTRKSVHQPLETGIKSIDSMIPVGKWQRELIIWDRQTGKTTIAIDTIINQKGKNVKCIYVAIGQKESKVKLIQQKLIEADAMEYTIIVSASASSPAVMQYLAPYTGITLAEYFMNNGWDSLIIYDDLSKHAVAYREISLLLRRPPGREAYPGDVFYLHSRLLERSAKLNEDYGSGSCTALPIIETLANDVSAYIPTNVISITDGQIFLETDLFNSWIRPAVNVWLSVSRVWWSAQNKLMKKVAGKLKLELAYFRELQAFAQFASDLDESTRNRIHRGNILTQILKQPADRPIPAHRQAIIIYAGINWYLDNIEASKISEYENALYIYIEEEYSDFDSNLQNKPELSTENENMIKEILTKFGERFAM